MDFLKDFLKVEDVTKAKIYPHLKCTVEEAKILQLLTRRYIAGESEANVYEILDELFGAKELSHITKLDAVKNLLDLGWVVQVGFGQIKEEYSKLELLHADIGLSTPFLRLLEEGNLEPNLPRVEPYKDRSEYFEDQFWRIELYRKIANAKSSFGQEAPSVNRLKGRLKLLEARIAERVEMTKIPLEVELLFEEYGLSSKEQIIFLALLKEEYTQAEGTLREQNALVDLISSTEFERIENRSLLEEGSTLLSSGLIDYDEVITPFGGISKSFFIPEETMHKILNTKSKKKKRLKLQNLIKEQDIFELIEPQTSLEDVVLHPQTKKRLETLVNQIDPKVARRLKEWGIKSKKRSLDARVILYGPPGTGKTMTALSLAKTLKKLVLSFDCSKILSMYVGESEKNVRKIFDTYKDLSQRAKTPPVLLLNEADQFLGARSQSLGSSADKMHNQMQNIFLEQIENFEGVLIATTNLLETIDPAFSRRFNYKIEFKKPDFAQRVELWRRLLPKNAPLDKKLDIERLARYELTGGQIELIVKNTAYTVAMRDNPVFTTDDFLQEIEKERNGAFGSEKSMGFLH